MQWFGSRATVAGLALLLVACGEGEANLTSVTYEFCRSLCTSWQRCGAGDAGCVNRCVAIGGFEHLRLDGVESIASCISRESCDVLLGETPTSACFEAAAEALPPSPVAVRYCEAESKKLFECNNWWSEQDCTDTVSLWTDDVLNAAALCHERQDCDEFLQCIETTFGAYQ